MNRLPLFLHLLATTAALVVVTGPAAAQNAVPLLINYEGELRDPTTGEPVADGSYDMLFRIYDVETGGSAVWEGTHTAANGNAVEVANGLFSVILGSGTGNAMAASVFNGPDRWLEMQVGAETLSPRQRITSAAFSIVSDNSRLLNGSDSSAFASATHGHSGADIGSGTVADARIDGAIARDSEIVPTVLANDGTGSGLDADTVDGIQGADLEESAEIDADIGAHAAIADAHHSKTITFAELTDTATDAQIPGSIARDSEIMPTVLANDGTGSGLDADAVDGIQGADLEESAEIDADIAAHAAIADAHHAKTTSFGKLTDTATDGQIPGSIARDSEIMPTVLANDGTGSGLDADAVDGIQGAALEESAEIDADILSHAGVADAHHAKTTSFTELTGAAADAQIPASIARDSEVTSQVATHGGIADAHHARYTNSEAVSAMGVKSDTNPLNHDKTTSLPWGSISSMPAGFVDGIDNDSGGARWSLTGNTGTSPGTNFLGTTNNVALQLHVNNARALRLEPHATSPNVIGGYGGNSITAGAYGATIGGGGQSSYVNSVTGNYGTVSGGIFNTASGYSATVGRGDHNTASSQLATVGGGLLNTSGELGTVGGGAWSLATGYAATVSGGATNYATGEKATVPGGNYNTAAGDYSFAAGRRAIADGDGSFVWGDSNDFDVHAWGANQFVVRATGGYWLFSAVDGSGTPTSGATLAAGSGTWGSWCDRNAKANCVPVHPRAVLEKVAALPISTWSYKTQDPSIRHLGPMAQDFYAAFGLGEDDKHIGTVDADGVALAAIQGLHEIVQEKDARISSLEKQNTELKARLTALEAVVRKLAQQHEGGE